MTDWDRVVELARISMENRVAAAVLRLHRDECYACSECGVTWPCPTVVAIEQVAARPQPLQLRDIMTGE